MSTCSPSCFFPPAWRYGLWLSKKACTCLLKSDMHELGDHKLLLGTSPRFYWRFSCAWFAHSRSDRSMSAQKQTLWLSWDSQWMWTSALARHWRERHRTEIYLGFLWALGNTPTQWCSAHEFVLFLLLNLLAHTSHPFIFPTSQLVCVCIPPFASAWRKVTY